MKLLNKRGISLVVLIISIIVLAILLGAVILQTQNSKLEGRSEEYKFKQSISTFMDELDLYLNQQKLEYAKENKVFNAGSFNQSNKTVISSSIIKSIKDTEYDGDLVIKNGRLALSSSNDFTDQEKQWFEQVN